MKRLNLVLVMLMFICLMPSLAFATDLNFYEDYEEDNGNQPIGIYREITMGQVPLADFALEESSHENNHSFAFRMGLKSSNSSVDLNDMTVKTQVRNVELLGNRQEWLNAYVTNYSDCQNKALDLSEIVTAIGQFKKADLTFNLVGGANDCALDLMAVKSREYDKECILLLGKDKINAEKTFDFLKALGSDIKVTEIDGDVLNAREYVIPSSAYLLIGNKKVSLPEGAFVNLASIFANATYQSVDAGEDAELYLPKGLKVNLGNTQFELNGSYHLKLNGLNENHCLDNGLPYFLEIVKMDKGDFIKKVFEELIPRCITNLSDKNSVAVDFVRENGDIPEYQDEAYYPENTLELRENECSDICKTLIERNFTAATIESRDKKFKIVIFSYNIREFRVSGGKFK